MSVCMGVGVGAGMGVCVCVCLCALCTRLCVLISMIIGLFLAF